MSYSLHESLSSVGFDAIPEEEAEASSVEADGNPPAPPRGGLRYKPVSSSAAKAKSQRRPRKTVASISLLEVSDDDDDDAEKEEAKEEKGKEEKAKAVRMDDDEKSGDFHEAIAAAAADKASGSPTTNDEGGKKRREVRKTGLVIRPTMGDRGISEVSFGGERNLETGSVKSLGSSSSGSQGSVDSDYSNKEGNSEVGTELNCDSHPFDKSEEGAKGIRFGSASLMGSGAVLHRASSLDCNQNDPDGGGGENAFRDSVATVDLTLGGAHGDIEVDEDRASVSTSSTVSTGGGRSGTFAYRPNSFKYRPTATAAATATAGDQELNAQSRLAKEESEVARGGSGGTFASVENGGREGSGSGSTSRGTLASSVNTFNYGNWNDDDRGKEEPRKKPKGALKAGKYAAAGAAGVAAGMAMATNGSEGYEISDSKMEEVPAANARQAPTGLAKGLSKTSRMYDLDGDGELNEAERIMRDLDVEGRGQLTTADVRKIVERHLESKRDYRQYRKVAWGVAMLVVMLALSNFGTSWATAVLSKETVAEGESGTIQSKKSGEIMGYQEVAYTVELEELPQEEYEARRKLVDREMDADPAHEDHVHRRLGIVRNRMCTGVHCANVAYDDGKIDENVLEDIVKRCDGANTVNIRRRWRNLDGEDDYYDYDALCGPGTRVARKRKKKRNRHGTKVRMVDERVQFKKRGRDGTDKTISFDCERGRCYTSGTALMQREGHPCHLSRAECDDGLVCYHNGRTRDLVGTCTMLQRYARRGQMCNVDHGVDACEGGLACVVEDAGIESREGNRSVRAGVCQSVAKRVGLGEVCDVSFGSGACAGGNVCLGANGREITAGLGVCARVIVLDDIKKRARSNDVCRLDFGANACEAGFACYSTAGRFVAFEARSSVTGICQGVPRRAGLGEWCDASYGNSACGNGYVCLDNNGREIMNGLGFCDVMARAGGHGGTIGQGGWHVDFNLGREGQCVLGRTEVWEADETYATAAECCEQKLWWMGKGQCAPDYY